MSLDFNLTKIKNYEELCWDDEDENGESRINPITQALIFQTAFHKQHKISESNWRDFYMLVSMHEKLFGAGVEKYVPKLEGEGYDRVPVFITAQDVFDHIGLSTNGGAGTIAAAKNHMVKCYVSEARDQCDKVTEEVNV